MMEKRPVTRLSVRAARVLLRVVLTRHLGVALTKGEFAALSNAGLNLIIQQDVKGISNAQLITVDNALPKSQSSGQGVGTGITDDVSDRPDVTQGVKHEKSVVAIQDGATVSSAGVVGTTQDEEVDQDPLEACIQADRDGSRADKKAALTRVWGVAFPSDQFDYEYAQLSDSFANWLTKSNRSAEWVGEIIQRIGEKWRGQHLNSPSGYIRAAVEGEEAKSKARILTPINRVEEEDDVDMDLMAEFARAWQAQKGKK